MAPPGPGPTTGPAPAVMGPASRTRGRDRPAARRGDHGCPTGGPRGGFEETRRPPIDGAVRPGPSPSTITRGGTGRRATGPRRRSMGWRCPATTGYPRPRAADSLGVSRSGPDRVTSLRASALGHGTGTVRGRPTASLSMNDVTRILSAIEQGDPQAAERLLPAGLRRAAHAGRAAAGPGEARPDPPGHGPGPRGLPAPGRPGERSGPGTAAATSSPPPPRRCAASSSTGRAPQAAEAGRRPPPPRAGPGRPPGGRRARPTTCSPSTRRSTGSPARPRRRPRLVKLRLLRRPDGRAGRRGPGHRPPHRRARLGLRPHLALRPARPARRAGLSPRSENLRNLWRAPGPDGA